MERERDQLSVTTDTSIISTASLFAQLVLAILAMQAQRHDDSSTAVDVIGTLVLHVAETLQIHTDIGHLQGGLWRRGLGKPAFTRSTQRCYLLPTAWT